MIFQQVWEKRGLMELEVENRGFEHQPATLGGRNQHGGRGWLEAG